MPTKTKEKIADFKPAKAVSVMVWIEVHFGRVLVLRPTQGGKLWPLPGDKVHSRESLISAAKRAVLKEEGLKIECSEYVGLLDRPQKPTLTFPFRAKLRAEARLTFLRRKRLNFSLQSGSATEICNATLILWL